jgi:hypothetical protein
MPTGGRERMTYHTAATKAGPALYVAAASAVASLVFAVLYLISYLCSSLGIALVGEMGSVSLIGLVIAAPVAVVTSLIVRCHTCDRLLIPLVYDGKSFFTSKSPNAWVIGKTAFMVVLHRRAPCPHCGAEAEV